MIRQLNVSTDRQTDEINAVRLLHGPVIYQPSIIVLVLFFEFTIAYHHIGLIHRSADLTGNLLARVVYTGKPVFIVLVLALTPHLPKLIRVVLIRVGEIKAQPRVLYPIINTDRAALAAANRSSQVYPYTSIILLELENLPIV